MLIKEPKLIYVAKTVLVPKKEIEEIDGVDPVYTR